MSASSRSSSAVPVALFAAGVPVLTRLPPAAWTKVVDRLARSRRDGADVEARIERGLALASRIAAQSCLVRGLTRYVFLRRAGWNAELALGIGRPAGDYAGHCWVEIDGEPYGETRDPREHFVEMLRLPSRRTA